MAGCAKQGYPPGGPVDRKGPDIVAVYPAPKSVNVPLSVKPSIKLNEWIQRNTVEKAIFISPEPEDGYHLKIGDKKVTVIFNSDLEENRTIVVTFGAGISDVNGNQMAESFVLAFATGDQMDSSRVAGYVRNMQSPSSTWIWAYPLNEFPDPDPRQDKAPFATQPDVDGSFQIGFLPRDYYRLFAVVESRQNRIWDVAREAIAFPPEDIQASSVAPPIISLWLGNVDLEPPALRGAEGVNSQAIRLSFTEPVRTDLLHVTGQDTLGGELSIVDVAWNQADSNAVLLTTGIQREGHQYHLLLNNVQDYAGNKVDSLEVDVQAAAYPDTIGPRVTWTQPAAGAEEISPDTTLRIGFSEPVTMTTLNDAIKVTEGDSIQVEGIWLSQETTIARFRPAETFKGNITYVVIVDNSLIKDIFNNPSPDSLQRFSFTTIDEEAVGSLSGKVNDPVDKLQVVANQLNEPYWTLQAPVREVNSFNFSRLLAGSYRLWLFQDSNEDGKLSAGSIDPFQFAEPFSVFLDSVRIRSRWETEDIELDWPVSPEWRRKVFEKVESVLQDSLRN